MKRESAPSINPKICQLRFTSFCIKKVWKSKKVTFQSRHKAPFIDSGNTNSAFHDHSSPPSDSVRGDGCQCDLFTLRNSPLLNRPEPQCKTRALTSFADQCLLRVDEYELDSVRTASNIKNLFTVSSNTTAAQHSIKNSGKQFSPGYYGPCNTNPPVLQLQSKNVHLERLLTFRCDVLQLGE